MIPPPPSSTTISQQLAAQKTENEKLLAELEKIRRERKQCRKELVVTNAQLESLQFSQSVTTANMESALVDEISQSKQIQLLESKLKNLQECNVEANDAFYISVASVDTTVATINGVRLCPSIHDASNWKEVNAALGQVTLLLSHLEEHYCYHRDEVLRYTLLPAGSQSKIGLRTAANNSSMYNLHYADDSFRLFGRRSFNTALGYLLGYVIDLTAAWQRQQQVTAGGGVPYSMDDEHHTVGGLSVLYSPTNNNDGENEWTRALKYLLTNIQHLLVYRAIGVQPVLTPLSLSS